MEFIESKLTAGMAVLSLVISALGTNEQTIASQTQIHEIQSGSFQLAKDSDVSPAAHVTSLIPPTDTPVLCGLSPYNWVCHEKSISSSVNGASLTIEFKGTRQVSVLVDADRMTNLVPARFPIIAWSANGGALQTHQLTPKDKSVVLASGVKNPVIDLYIKGMSPFEDRWSGDVPINSVIINGFVVDEGGTTSNDALSDKVWLNIGDSIMSGDCAVYAPGQGRPPNDLWAASDDGRASYAFLLAQHYGFREARLAYGGYDWGGGMAKVPAVSTLIDQRTTTVSRLSSAVLSPIPAVVLINLGENGPPADGDVIAALVKLRSRVNQATKIFVMIPVSGKAKTEVTRAFSTYQNAAKDKNAHLIDLGRITFSTADGQHPTAAGHEAIFKAALPAFDAVLGGGDTVNLAGKIGLGQSFWKPETMTNEPVLFVQEQGRLFATGKLLFPPRSDLRITQPDQVTAYVAGKDFLWNPGSQVIELTADSHIPFKTATEMLPPPGSSNTIGGVLWSEGHYFHDLQVQVSYTHDGKFPLPNASPPPPLTRSLEKLRSQQPFKIVALGDSITEGYNASGFEKTKATPYQPSYPQLVANTLQERFDSPITLVNLGQAGTRANWGLGMVSKVAGERPDLVILAFGMNHSQPAAVFESVMRRLRDAVQAAAPQADIVLVACMTANPHLHSTERYAGYRDALRHLELPNAALADVTTPWVELLKQKTFSDLSGNNVNHPNDFGHRLYAQVICELLPSDNSSR